MYKVLLTQRALKDLDAGWDELVKFYPRYGKKGK